MPQTGVVALTESLKCVTFLGVILWNGSYRQVFYFEIKLHNYSTPILVFFIFFHLIWFVVKYANMRPIKMELLINYFALLNDLVKIVWLYTFVRTLANVRTKNGFASIITVNLGFAYKIQKSSIFQKCCRLLLRLKKNCDLRI